MAYLESNLGRNEEIIAKAQISKTPLVPNVIFSILLSILVEIVTVIPFISNDFIEDGELGAGALVGLFFWDVIVRVPIFLLLIVLPKMLSIRSTELGLTNKRVVGKCGVISTKVMDSPIGKVNSISVEQGLAGRIFGYSKIIISTSSGGFIFNYIKYADAFRNAVLEEMDKAEEERDRRQADMLAGAMNCPEK